ncbi:hypothetical protein [Lysobacter sp. CA199]|uniref:hypothetical protein n=1 Tax=Lysobacter sp. CA199 TaxID=3455608 RepID=UPI003F8D157A
MEYDDKIRTKKAVVVCLRDMGDGTSRFFFDDVDGNQESLPIDWKHNSFFTFTPAFDNAALDEMSLDDDWYQQIGVMLAARLLALNKRVK